MSNKKILGITKGDIQYKQFSVKFTNKAKPRPVRAKTVHDFHQIDLVDMVKMKLEHKGKCYKYNLLVLDIFSKFHWLAPLESKSAFEVKGKLEQIYLIHGTPKRMQNDNGGEFKKGVKQFCKGNKINMIKSRPYNPKAQGKVERSHRVLRKKIYYDMSKMKKNRVNWVKNLPMYMKCLNNDKREDLVGKIFSKCAMDERITKF